MRSFLWCSRALFPHSKLRPGVPRLPLVIFPTCPCGRLVSTSAKRSSPARNRRWPYYVAGLGISVGTFVTYTSWKESTSRGVLQPETFTPFTIIAKEPVSSTSTIFTLRPTNAPWSAKPYEHLWTQGVWSIQVKQPQLQIARAYTPLPPQATSTGPGVEKSNGFRFLIRKEDGGEVSSYLHKLPFGSTVELRGPNPEFDIPKDVGEVLFLAGGTGIAPALQVTHAVLSQVSGLENGKTPNIHILWANRRREDCLGGINSSHRNRKVGPMPQAGANAGLRSPTTTTKTNAIVKELEALNLRYPGRVNVDYFVDEEGTSITGDSIKQCISNSLTASGDTATKVPSKKLVIVSGPNGFVSTLAGAKVWESGREVQGRLGGVLSRLNFQGWTVWKL